MDTVICKEVIITTLRRRGDGTQHNPIRAITEVYEKNGLLIAELDPSPETFVKMDLIHFARFLKKNNFDADKCDHRIVSKWLDSIKSKT